MISFRRFLNTTYLDLRLQYRNGFYYVILLAMLTTMIFLSQIPKSLAELLFPVMLFTNVIIGTFLFMGSIVLFEHDQRIPEALNVTPIRPEEYIMSKVLTLTFLSVMECIILVLYTNYVLSVSLSVINLIVGYLFLSSIYCLAGFIMVAKYGDFNSFMSRGIGIGMILSFPFLNFFLDNSLLKTVFYLIPTNPALLVMTSKDTVFSFVNFGLLLLNSMWILFFFRYSIKYYVKYYEQRREL